MVNRLGWAAGLAGCVMWAIGLAVWQNDAENALAGSPPLAENFTYWARDFRYAAVLLAIAGLVLAANGGWVANAAGLLVLAAWIGADVVLDRADFASPWQAAGAACVLFGVVAWAVSRRRGSGRSLYFWSLALVFLAVFGSMFMQTNDELVPLVTAVAGGALTVAAIATAGALAVASSGRRWTWGRVVVCAVLSAMACAVLVVRHYKGEPDNWWLLLGPVASLLVGMVLISGRRVNWILTLPAVVALAVFAIVPYVALLMLSDPVAGALTKAAGSPPVHGGDIDVLLSFNLFLIGVLIALVLLAVTRVRTAPKQPMLSTLERTH